MSTLTRIFLVLLRLAIGWHFLFEGIEKVGNPSWSSEPYLREASGPLAPAFRWLAGDPVLERVTPLPKEGSEDQSPHDRIPPLLGRDWQIYYDTFLRHYQLNDESGLSDEVAKERRRQRTLAEKKFDQQKSQYVTWLETGKKRVKREGPGAPVAEVEVRVSERIQEYQDKLERARQIQDVEMATFGSDVNARLRAAKADANRIRAELNTDVTQKSADMRKSLQEVLTAEQKDTVEPLPETVSRRWFETRYWTDRTRLEWIDWTTRWGLLAVGVCLLLGLFSRTACVAGAVYLLLFFLAMPPLPWVPEVPRAEGHYLLINKNIIEMLALLVLATTASGRWVGLDGLIGLLRRDRGRKLPPPDESGDPPRVMDVLPVEPRAEPAPDGNGRTEPEPVSSISNHGSRG